MNEIESDLKQLNEVQLDLILRTFSPEFWKVYHFAKETNMNPDWLCRIIRGVERVQSGIGYGKVVVEIREKEIKKVENSETDIGLA